MFEHLVESTTHKQETSRRSLYTLGTLALWVTAFTGTAAWQVWAYAADLNQTSEQITLLAPPPPPPAPPPSGPSSPTPTPKNAVAVTDQPPVKIPDKIEEAPKSPTLRTRDLGESTPDAGVTGGVDGGIKGGVPGGSLDGVPGGSGTGEAPPPPDPPVKPEPPVQTGPVRRSEGVLRGNAINKVTPAYPPIAKQTGVSGDVTVEVLIDENGRVVSARALGGPALLQQTAVAAARGWSFRPTLLNGQAVKVTGAITFRFNLGN